MSTTVTKSPNTVASVDNLVGTFGVAWTTPGRAKTSNDLYATNIFNGSSGHSQSLYASDWGFNLDEFAVIEDIELNVERKKTGTGTVRDLRVQLEKNGSRTADNSKPDAWATTDDLVTYTGLWNENWNSTHINATTFGCYFAAQSDSTNLNTAFVDSFSLTITYHLEIEIEGSGGGSCGGSATVEFFETFEGSGGISVGGEVDVGVLYLNYDGTGGTLTEGNADVREEISTSGGMVIDGTAVISFNDIGSGGGVVGGSAISDLNDQIETSGGVTLGGEAPFESGLYGSGGVSLCGEAFPYGGTIVETSQGGCVLGGSAEVQCILNIDLSGEGVATKGQSINGFIYSISTEGGIAISGTSVIGIGIAVSGGISIGGETNNQINFEPMITGGITTSGNHMQTFIDYFIASGGLRAGGKGIGDKIKFFQKYKTGICRALLSDNICKKDLYQKELLSPPGSETGELDPNRVRIEYLPTWCELKEKLQPYEKVSQDCDAAVPAIIKSRQKGIVPPKSGRVQVRDRGIATADIL